jgi:hypothetical protein
MSKPMNFYKWSINLALVFAPLVAIGCDSLWDTMANTFNSKPKKKVRVQNLDAFQPIDPSLPPEVIEPIDAAQFMDFSILDNFKANNTTTDLCPSTEFKPIDYPEELGPRFKDVTENFINTPQIKIPYRMPSSTLPGRLSFDMQLDGSKL